MSDQDAEIPFWDLEGESSVLQSMYDTWMHEHNTPQASTSTGPVVGQAAYSDSYQSAHAAPSMSTENTTALTSVSADSNALEELFSGYDAPMSSGASMSSYGMFQLSTPSYAPSFYSAQMYSTPFFTNYDRHMPSLTEESEYNMRWNYAPPSVQPGASSSTGSTIAVVPAGSQTEDPAREPMQRSTSAVEPAAACKSNSEHDSTDFKQVLQVSHRTKTARNKRKRRVEAEEEEEPQPPSRRHVHKRAALRPLMDAVDAEELAIKLEEASQRLASAHEERLRMSEMRQLSVFIHKTTHTLENCRIHRKYHGEHLEFDNYDEYIDFLEQEEEDEDEDVKYVMIGPEPALMLNWGEGERAYRTLIAHERRCKCAREMNDKEFLDRLDKSKKEAETKLSTHGIWTWKQFTPAYCNRPCFIDAGNLPAFFESQAWLQAER